MKFLLLHVTCLSFAFMACSQLKPIMFRGTPEHTGSVTSKNNFVLGNESWRFNADAPIRSTAICNNNLVFFGSSKGIFYALDKSTGNIKWQFNSGFAINSSPALHNGNVFFSDNKQTLYALNQSTGKIKWKLDFDKSLNYDWGFDYYYSSPTIVDNKILIGIKDGFVYNINEDDGKTIWKFKTEGIVRSTPAVKDKLVFFGDTEGILYAVDFKSGKEIWRFKSVGNSLENEDFGFDRRSIISSPTIADNKVIFGCRDGFFYAVSMANGKELWHVDHKVSWVISSIAVKDTIAVTGTSDGRFVQAVSTNTGKELWKFKTLSIVWSSPVIYNNQVYIGSQEGVLYCLDLTTGKKVNSFQGSGKIFTSPVISDSLLLFGTDKGYLFALHPSKYTFPSVSNIKRYVFWQQDADPYFHYGNNEKIRIYLNANHYETIDAKKLLQLLLQTDSAKSSVIVFAENLFPKEIYNGYNKCALRTYLNAGGRIVVTGINPLIYRFDSTGDLEGFNFLMADSVLGIHYGANDLRSMGGVQPAFATDVGERWGLQNSFTSFLPLNENQVDVALGKDENGKVAAWLKRFSNIKTSGFIQLWIDPDFVDDMSSIIRVAEYGFD
jgi:outer membrane protein assembly factor BamB